MASDSMDKKKLDSILEKHNAQPVGHGYIDIIVSRDNYRGFVSDLVSNGFKVKSISWWEWCPENKRNEYGMGGPQSDYYNGWFAELGDIDDLNLSMELANDKVICEIINRIEEKTISFPKETITFELNKWLTPAIWLDVPDDWRNKEGT